VIENNFSLQEITHLTIILLSLYTNTLKLLDVP